VNLHHLIIQPVNSQHVGEPTVTQRAIGTLVLRESKQKTSKGVRTYRKYWIYLPNGLAEDKLFPFKAGERLLISIIDTKILTLERA